MYLRCFAVLRNTHLTIFTHSDKFPPLQVNPLHCPCNTHYSSTKAESLKQTNRKTMQLLGAEHTYTLVITQGPGPHMPCYSTYHWWGGGADSVERHLRISSQGADGFCLISFPLETETLVCGVPWISCLLITSRAFPPCVCLLASHLPPWHVPSLPTFIFFSGVLLHSDILLVYS